MFFMVEQIMATSKITNKNEFQELIWEDSDIAILIEDEITDNGRWVIYHSSIWSEDHADGIHYFGYTYDTPATESQEGSESEFNANGIEELFHRQVTVTKYYSQREIDALEKKASAKVSEVTSEDNSF